MSLAVAAPCHVFAVKAISVHVSAVASWLTHNNSPLTALAADAADDTDASAVIPPDAAEDDMVDVAALTTITTAASAVTCEDDATLAPPNVIKLAVALADDARLDDPPACLTVSADDDADADADVLDSAVVVIAPTATTEVTHGIAAAEFRNA